MKLAIGQDHRQATSSLARRREEEPSIACQRLGTRRPRTDWHAHWRDSSDWQNVRAALLQDSRKTARRTRADAKSGRRKPAHRILDVLDNECWALACGVRIAKQCRVSCVVRREVSGFLGFLLPASNSRARCLCCGLQSWPSGLDSGYARAAADWEWDWGLVMQSGSPGARQGRVHTTATGQWAMRGSPQLDAPAPFAACVSVTRRAACYRGEPVTRPPWSECRRPLFGVAIPQTVTECGCRPTLALTRGAVLVVD